MDSDEIIFELDNCPKEDLDICKIGQHVNLWLPKDGRQEIHIFRSGSVGGQGRLGFVPKEYIRIIANQIEQKLKYSTEIIEINKRSAKCKIKFTVDSERMIINKQTK